MPNVNYSVTAAVDLSGANNQPNRLVSVGDKTVNGFRLITTNGGSITDNINASPVNYGFNFAVHAANTVAPQAGVGADAWILVGGAGENYGSFNATSTAPVANVYEVTFTTPMPSAAYAVIGQSLDTNPYTISFTEKTATGFKYTISQQNGTLTTAGASFTVFASSTITPTYTWTRNGTTLEPANAGDDLRAAAGTFSADTRVGENTGSSSQNLSSCLLKPSGYAALFKSTTTSDPFITCGVSGAATAFQVSNDGTISNPNITLNADGRVVANTTGSAHQFDRNVTENDTNSVIFFNSNGNGNARIATSGKFVSKATGGTQTWFAGGSTNNDNYEVKNSGGTGCKIVSGQNTWTTLSDERSKTSLVPITGGLEKVKDLRAVTGRYLTDEEGVSRPFLIAQDVQAVLPEAVVEDSEGLNVNYDGIIPLLVSALHDAKDRIEALEAEIQQLKSQSPES